MSKICCAKSSKHKSSQREAFREILYETFITALKAFKYQPINQMPEFRKFTPFPYGNVFMKFHRI